MSIDARVHSAERLKNGNVKLYLAPREKGGVAGQNSLEITNFPRKAPLEGLVDVEIWGGSGEIMVGERKWAERRGYRQIILVCPPLRSG